VTSLDPEVECIAADRLQMRQVLHNLVKNALEAQAEASVEGKTKGPEAASPVVLSTHRLKRRDGRAGVRLRVRDHGPGFSEDMLARVFEPYVTTKASGSGLGLAIVRKIVEEHGARIEVSRWSDEAGVSAGAQVSIVFPIDERSG